MKLQLSLPERAGLIYTAPVLDVVILLMIFFLLASNFVIRSGIAVEEPFSSSNLPAVAQSHLVTLTPGPTGKIFFNEDQVDLAELTERLRASPEEIRAVIFRADRNAAFGSVVEISNLILEEGFDLYYSAGGDSAN